MILDISLTLGLARLTLFFKYGDCMFSFWSSHTPTLSGFIFTIKCVLLVATFE